MSEYKHKRHNVSVLLYHIVCPAKYRKIVFTTDVDMKLKDICLEIGKRYEIEFLEIGTDKEHVHFLIQSVPMYSPKQLVQIIKSISAKQIFKICPEVKQQLWGGEFWSDGYYVSTVGQYGNEQSIQHYVKNQGNEQEYRQLHTQQLKLL